jgi:hypothetical protein
VIYNIPHKFKDSFFQKDLDMSLSREVQAVLFDIQERVDWLSKHLGGDDKASYLVYASLNPSRAVTANLESFASKGKCVEFLTQVKAWMKDYNLDVVKGSVVSSPSTAGQASMHDYFAQKGLWMLFAKFALFGAAMNEGEVRATLCAAFPESPKGKPKDTFDNKVMLATMQRMEKKMQDLEKEIKTVPPPRSSPPSISNSRPSVSNSMFSPRPSRPPPPQEKPAAPVSSEVASSWLAALWGSNPLWPQSPAAAPVQMNIQPVASQPVSLKQPSASSSAASRAPVLEKQPHKKLYPVLSIPLASPAAPVVISDDEDVDSPTEAPLPIPKKMALDPKPVTSKVVYVPKGNQCCAKTAMGRRCKNKIVPATQLCFSHADP